MFAFKIKPGSSEFLTPLLDIPAFEAVEGVVYYVVVDPDTAPFVLSAQELTELEEADGEEFIRFE